MSENVPTMFVITPYKVICSITAVSTLDWTVHCVFVSMSWENMHVISNLHDFCRLHPLIQGPTFSSLCNIAFLASNQNCSCCDRAWTDKMFVCTSYTAMMIQTGPRRNWGLFVFCPDAAKTPAFIYITCSLVFFSKYLNKFRSNLSSHT